MWSGLRARTFLAAALLALVVCVALGAFLVPYVRDAVADGDRGAATAGVVGALVVGAALLIGAGGLLALWVTRALDRLRTELTERLAGRATGPLVRSGLAEIDAITDACEALFGVIREQAQRGEAETRRLEQTLSAAADIVLAVSEDGTLVYANDAASAVLNVPAATAAGRPLLRVLIDHEVHALVQTALTEGAATQLVRRDDRRYEARARRIEGGGQWAAVALLQDISALQEAEAGRRELVANISHELRTPIAAISAAVETLESGVSGSDAERFHTIIHREVDRMAQTVEEMLDLARLESGLAQPQLQTLPAGLLLREAAERMSPQAERAGLTLEVTDPSPNPYVSADPDLVQRALVNLLHNAIKFTEAPGSIRLSARAEDPGVWLEVTDTGIGIAKADQPKVFQRFFRADPARDRAGGTGLGLALVRHIAEAHGGDVRVASELGRGSTFGLRLPAAERPAPAARSTG